MTKDGHRPRKVTDAEHRRVVPTSDEFEDAERPERPKHNGRICATASGMGAAVRDQRRRRDRRGANSR